MLWTFWCPARMWQVEKDFRGDASQTLRALPLAAAFSMEVLADHAEMQKEIASLTTLYAVILAWLACKRGDVTQVQTNVLRQKQKRHAEQFVAAYGWAEVPTQVALQHAQFPIKWTESNAVQTHLLASASTGTLRLHATCFASPTFAPLRC